MLATIWKLLWLLSIWTHVGGTAPQYQLFNFTWQISNGAGDVGNSSSVISSGPPFDPIYVDLCQLALGGHHYWGTPDYFEIKRPRELWTFNIDPGCANRHERQRLKDDISGIYVCPGTTHKDRTLNYHCGYTDDYYCASWGCETTGDTYWKPSSSWDYITVKRYNPSSWDCFKGGWCNPLIINFTSSGRNIFGKTSHTFEWGLCLYQEGIDFGLLLRICLLKEVPCTKPMSIGPNPVLHLGRPQPSVLSPALAVTPTVYSPASPQGAPSSAEAILSVVNASMTAFHASNNSRYKGCWVCFSPRPPFYEGLAIFGSLNFSNKTEGLRWHPVNSEGLTLGQTLRIGLCLRGPALKFPQPLLKICNQTIVVNTSYLYISAPKGHYFACALGLTT